ncbi:hypothetical protein D3C78_1401580 [compost metagenome]
MHELFQPDTVRHLRPPFAVAQHDKPVAQQFFVRQIRVRWRHRGECEVHLMVHQTLDAQAVGTVMQRDARGADGVLQRGAHLRQNDLGQRGPGRDRQLHRGLLGRRLHALQAGFVLADDGAGNRCQLGAACRELHAARGALEQRQTQGGFEVAYDLAQRWLRHEQLLGRLAEVERLAERQKHAQVLGGDIHSF